MAFALILLGLIFGGILTIITIIFAIISLANGKSKNALMWGIGFAISLTIVLVSVFQMVTRVTDKVKSGIDWVKEQENVQNINNDETKKAERQEWLDSLQLHNIEKYEDKIPADYYINKPAEKDPSGNLIIPFLYPYVIKYDPSAYTGNIVMQFEDSVLVDNVSQIAFDKNFAIIKSENKNSPELLKAGRAEIEYHLFDLRTRNYETAPNLEKLLDLANRIGYEGPIQMQYLSDACRGYTEDVTYGY